MKKQSFTLIELLVVVAIIGILIAILLPALGIARSHARALKCQTNMNGLMKGVLFFTHDHKEVLPGNTDTSEESEVWKTSWLFGQSPLYDYTASFLRSPDKGTLFSYVGQMKELYRCPSQPFVEFNSGTGSNGKFDYAIIQILAGAMSSHLNLGSRFKNPDGTYQSLLTPIFVEESPEACLNNANIEGAHGGIDRMSSVHGGKGHFTSIDGSIHSFKQPPFTQADNWELETMQGKWIPCGGWSFWGYWEKQ